MIDPAEAMAVMERLSGSIARRWAHLCDGHPSISPDDLRQEAMAAMWMASHHRRTPVPPVEAYVIGKHAAFALAKRQRPRRNLQCRVHPLADWDGAAAISPDADCTPLDVREAVAALPPACRDAARRQMQGWKHHESAAAEGITVLSSRDRMRRAARLLRSSLASYAPDAQ